MTDNDDLNRIFHQDLTHKYAWLFSLRPMRLATFFIRLFAPDERRRIVSTEMGLRLYLDPFSHLGHEIITHNIYEPETINIFREELRPGQTMLDVGANEGIFTTLAGTLVGEQGLVIAVEPQSRLRDLIEINLQINNVKHFKIYQNALGGKQNDSMQLQLYPTLNTGASSLVKSYRFSKQRETVKFISFATILQECSLDHVDFIKVDVEGFEHQVIQELLPFLEAGQVGKLLLDYHKSILLAQQVNPQDIHAAIVSRRMKVKSGDVQALSSYVLYEKAR